MLRQVTKNDFFFFAFLTLSDLVYGSVDPDCTIIDYLFLAIWRRKVFLSQKKDFMPFKVPLRFQVNMIYTNVSRIPLLLMILMTVEEMYQQ